MVSFQGTVNNHHYDTNLQVICIVLLSVYLFHVHFNLVTSGFGEISNKREVRHLLEGSVETQRLLEEIKVIIISKLVDVTT